MNNIDWKKIKGLITFRTLRGYCHGLGIVLFFIIVTGVLYFSASVQTEEWLAKATLFNNAISPFLVIVTVMLLYKTWELNKRELKELKQRNDEHATRQQEKVDLQRRETKDFRIEQNLYSLFVAVSPKIDKAIENIKNGPCTTEICLRYSIFSHHEKDTYFIREADNISAKTDLTELITLVALRQHKEVISLKLYEAFKPRKELIAPQYAHGKSHFSHQFPQNLIQN